MASLFGPPAMVKDNLSVKSEELCVICDDVLKKPVYQLLKCGHRICGPCNKKICSEYVKATRCPGNESQCTDVDITNEYDKTEDTSFNILLEREEKCKYEKFGCRKMLKKKDLDSHLTQCMYKMGFCNFSGCNKTMPIEDLVDHKLNCEYGRKKCFKCKQSFSETEMASHKCLENLVEQFKDLLLSKEQYKIITAENQILRSKLLELSNENAGCRDNLNVVEDMVKKEEFKAEKLQQIFDMADNIDSIKIKLHSNYTAITNLELQSCDPITLQKSKYNEKYESFVMKIDVKTLTSENIIESESFYIPKYGYRLRLTVLPHEKWRLLFLTLDKGEYDTLLTWPFIATITLTLVSHKGNALITPCTEEHEIGEACSHEEDLQDLQVTFKATIPKTTLGPNVCFDNPLVVSDAQIRSGWFTSDNHVYIKANIEVHNRVNPDVCDGSAAKAFPESGRSDGHNYDAATCINQDTD